MQVTHFGHSCVLLDTGGTRLLIDPGKFSSGFEEVRDLDAILITHRHFDHVDTERLPALAAANPRARVIAAAHPGASGVAVAADLDDLGLHLHEVRPGEHLELGSSMVDAVGGDHAVIHSDVPVVPNTGYVLDEGAFYHPGDSLFVPEQRIDVLCVPVGAPWLKVAEAVDFVRTIEPRIAIPIHEAALSHLEIHYGWLERLSPEATTFTVLPRGETVKF